MAVDSKKALKAANVFFQEGRWEKALDAYLKLLEIDPRDLALQTLIADLQAKTENFPASFAAYKIARDGYLKQGPVDKLLAIRRKMAALDSSALDNAMKEEQNLVKNGLDADLAFEKGNLDQAQELFEKMIGLEPGNLTTRDKLAEIYIQKKLLDKAIAELLILGNSCSKVRAHAQAEEYFQKVVDLQPDHFQARSSLAEVTQRRGNNSEAKKQFLALAQSLLDAGEFEKALPYADKALKLRSIEAYFILGRIAMHRKQNEDAAKYFTELLRFKVAHVGALVYLAAVKAADGDLEHAVATMGRAISAQPENPELVERLGEYCAQKGSSNEAAENFCRSAEIYIEKKNLEKAHDVLQKAVGLSPEGDRERKMLAEVLRDQELSKEASEAFEILGDIYQKAESMEEAGAAYGEAVKLDSTNSSVAAKMSGLGTAPAPLDLSPSAVAEAAPPASPEINESPSPSSDGGPLHSPAAPSHPAPVVAPMNTDVIRWVTMGDVYAEKNLHEDALLHYRKAEAVDPAHPGLTDKIKNVVDVLGQKVREEARKAAEAEAQSKIEEEARKKAEADASKKLEEENQRKAEIETRVKIEEEARREAEEDARKRTEAEAAKKLEVENQKKADLEAKAKLEEEQAQRKLQDEAAKRLEDETRQKTEEEARLKSEKEALQKKESQQKDKKQTSKAPGEPKKAVATQSSEVGGSEEPDEEEYMTVSVAEIYKRRGQKSQAVRVLKKILKKQPHHQGAANLLDEIQGRPKRAPVSSRPDKSAEKGQKSSSKPAKQSEKKKKPKSRISYI